MLLIAYNNIIGSIDFRTDPDMPLMLTDPYGNTIVHFILSYVYEANLWIFSSKCLATVSLPALVAQCVKGLLPR